VLNSIKDKNNIFYSIKKEKMREERRVDENLREVWVKISIKKIDIHKEVATKALLNSGVTRLFTCFEFDLIKLKEPVLVKNVDGTYNMKGVIKYEIKINLYY